MTSDRLPVELLAGLDEYVRGLVRDAVRAELATIAAGEPGRRWLTLEEAGERLGVTAAAVRMRVKRGRLEARRQGRRLYVSSESVDRLA